MSQYTSYYLYQKYEQRGSQNPIPVYPAVYSADAEGTMPMVVKLSNDPNCGYTIDSEPIYRWQNMNIATDYICDNYNKYYKQKKQVSYDGLTWQDVIPSEYQMGALYESNSTDCGYVPTFDGKLLAYYGSEVYTVECNGDGVLKQTETHPGGWQPEGSGFVNAITKAIVGNCVTTIGERSFFNCKYLTSIAISDSVTSIGEDAFLSCLSLRGIYLPSGVTEIGYEAFIDCRSLTSVTIPNSVTSIGGYAFAQCSGLTNVTIGNGVTNIGEHAFFDCRGLTSITCLATTPPSLGTRALVNTNNCPIYVPAASLSAYQTASGWSDYASRLRAIST